MLRTCDFKHRLTPTEHKDFRGNGTRTYGGVPLRWMDRWRVVHACEAVEPVPDRVLVWAVCDSGTYLPSDAHYLRAREITCAQCLAAFPDNVFPFATDVEASSP